MSTDNASMTKISEDAIKDRLRDLAQTVWGGNLARMARDLHLPQPGLWKIIHSDQPINARLLVALIRQTDTNLHWLVTGEGRKSLGDETAVLRGRGVVVPRIPVATQLLPGLPGEHRELLTGSPDPFAILSRSQYWLQVQRSDPVARYTDEHVHPGDWLLLETDRARFPSSQEMERKLVVVPGKAPRLARVLETDDDSLAVDVFDATIDLSHVEEEIVLRELPDGTLHAVKRKVLRDRPARKGHKLGRRRPLNYGELLYTQRQVKYADLLAVCVLHVSDR
jgi:hypothetical protein